MRGIWVDRITASDDSASPWGENKLVYFVLLYLQARCTNEDPCCQTCPGTRQRLGRIVALHTTT